MHNMHSGTRRHFITFITKYDISGSGSGCLYRTIFKSTFNNYSIYWVKKMHLSDPFTDYIRDNSIIPLDIFHVSGRIRLSDNRSW